MDTRPLTPPVYLFVAMLAMLVLDWLAPVIELLPWPWRPLGLAPIALGAGLDLAAMIAMRRHGTTTDPAGTPKALVTGGAYRLSRHPMYLGLVLILIGIAVLLGSLTPFGVAALFAVLVDRLFARPEEVRLERIFGEQWRRYRGKVRRWL